MNSILKKCASDWMRLQRTRNRSAGRPGNVRRCAGQRRGGPRLRQRAHGLARVDQPRRRAGGAEPAGVQPERDQPGQNPRRSPAPSGQHAFPTVTSSTSFETDQLRAGDVLFVGSVSGKTANVVELALQARRTWPDGDRHDRAGLQLEAGLGASLRKTPVRGGRPGAGQPRPLWRCHAAPWKGWTIPICPASGMGAAVLMWAVVAGIVEEMLARGLKPTVIPSVNRPDGWTLVAPGGSRSTAKRGY